MGAAAGPGGGGGGVQLYKLGRQCVKNSTGATKRDDGITGTRRFKHMHPPNFLFPFLLACLWVVFWLGFFPPPVKNRLLFQNKIEKE